VIKLRIRVIAILAILIFSASWTPMTSAKSGGEGDDIRSMQCGGSCHSDPALNATSAAMVSVEQPSSKWAGLLTTVTVNITDFPESETRIVGVFLLTNDQGAKDTPQHEGWTIVADPNGGVVNYIETRVSNGETSVSVTWTLKAPVVAGNYTLLASIHHGGVGNSVSIHGNSWPISFTIDEPPEDLPRLASTFTPPNTRLVNQETIITLETEDVTDYIVEMRVPGAQSVTLDVVEGTFTIPPAINSGSIEWRATLSGVGPDQQTPWFTLIAKEEGWQSDRVELYLQAFSLLFLMTGLVLVSNRKPRAEKIDLVGVMGLPQPDITAQIISEPQQHSTPVVEHNPVISTIPPVPIEGLPAGWTMEQWQHYGEQYLQGGLR
jgi:hypothetical protein|tara:strand:- start:1080 stop:2213 length:1134 start_codon:yes stop_codon:yes gene_type:complete